MTAPIAIPPQARVAPWAPTQRGAQHVAAPVAPAPVAQIRGAGTPSAPVATAPAVKRRRKWPWIVAAAFLLLVIVSVASQGPAAAPTAATGSTAAAGSAPAAGSAAPTGTTAPAAPAFVPKTYSGKGDDVVTIEKPEGTAVMAFSCPKCSGNTIVQSDGAESLLVNTIGSYSGKKWLDAQSGSTTSRLTIKATGSWTVKIGGLDQATQANGPVSGKGDDVIQLAGNSSTAAVTNKGEGNFIVQAVSGSSLFGTDLAVNEIGSYTGTVPLNAPALVQVTSEGSWSITPG